MPASATTVGIDIAKHHLDVHLDPQHLSFRVDNNPQGIAHLVEQLRPHQPARIIIESTGGYEKAVMHQLVDARLPVALVNPRPVRHFAKAMGLLAKTDRIDAKVLACFARKIETRVYEKPDEAREKLKQLVTRRRQLVELKTTCINHQEHVTDEVVKQSIERTIIHLQTEIKAIEVHIQEAINASEELKTRSETLQTVKGVGPAVARVLVTELPELGRIDRRSLAALVGVAPMNHDSGKQQGKRSIRGGRATVRAALYMATFVATRRNTIIQAHYEHLVKQGKPRKVALVACMRKMLVHLNSLMRNDQHASKTQKQT